MTTDATTDTWQSVGILAKAAFLTQNTRGCRYCNTYMVFTTEHGYEAHYPGVECCPAAVKRQIGWRTGDIDTIKAQIQRYRDSTADLRRQEQDAQTRALKDSLEVRIGKAERSFTIRMTDQWKPALEDLSNDIARLKRKLEDLEADPTQQPAWHEK